jgi:hypothetical protein
MSRKYGAPRSCGSTDFAASMLEAVVTAEMINGVARRGGAAHADRLGGLAQFPAANRMSQTAIVSTPSSRRPAALGLAGFAEADEGKPTASGWAWR